MNKKRNEAKQSWVIYILYIVSYINVCIYVKEPKLWKRWRLLCGLKQTFWQAWSRHYILGLQAKTKWSNESPNLKLGQVVIIHEDNCPPQHWLTGRVVKVIEGEDGKVRVAEVATRNGVYKPPIHKLAPLPND